MKHLRNAFKNFYGGYPDITRKYQRSVKDMMADSFPGQFQAVAQLVFESFLIFLILILSFGLSLFIN